MDIFDSVLEEFSPRYILITDKLNFIIFIDRRTNLNNYVSKKTRSGVQYLRKFEHLSKIELE